MDVMSNNSGNDYVSSKSTPKEVSTRVENQDPTKDSRRFKTTSSRVRSFRDREERLRLSKESGISLRLIERAYRQSGVVGVAKLLSDTFRKECQDGVE